MTGGHSNWLLGFTVFHVAGGLIHLLLVGAIIVVLWLQTSEGPETSRGKSGLGMRIGIAAAIVLGALASGLVRMKSRDEVGRAIAVAERAKGVREIVDHPTSTTPSPATKTTPSSKRPSPS